jgi:hypothetical protein
MFGLFLSPASFTSLHRQAQRAMGASTAGGQQRPGPPLDFSSLNINVPAVPIPGINTGREAQYARRIKELEDELRLMRVENEKNVCRLSVIVFHSTGLIIVVLLHAETYDCQVPRTLGEA